jgi:hypothetical protein
MKKSQDYFSIGLKIVKNKNLKKVARKGMDAELIWEHGTAEFGLDFCQRSFKIKPFSAVKSEPLCASF